jgi:hypothetical protein
MSYRMNVFNTIFKAKQDAALGLMEACRNLPEQMFPITMEWIERGTLRGLWAIRKQGNEIERVDLYSDGYTPPFYSREGLEWFVGRQSGELARTESYIVHTEDCLLFKLDCHDEPVVQALNRLENITEPEATGTPVWGLPARFAKKWEA